MSQKHNNHYHRSPQWLQDQQNAQHEADKARRIGQSSIADVYGGSFAIPQAAMGSWMYRPPSEATAPEPAPTIEPRTEPLYGWRAFDLRPDGRLQGLHMQAWEERKFQAECSYEASIFFYQMGYYLAGTLLTEPEPQPTDTSARDRCLIHLQSATCHCGLYGGTETEALEYSHPIIARVLAYGTVVVDDRGVFRASDVMLEELCINKGWIESQLLGKYVDVDRLSWDLFGRYETPVRVISSREELN